MFSLYAAMPTYDERRDPDALANIRRWMSSNPELAERYPADAILARLLPERTDR